MIQVEISPDTRTALMDWAQDILAAANAPDDTVREARSVYRTLDAGPRLMMTREAANEILRALWSVKLECSADADAIRRAVYPGFDHAPAMAEAAGSEQEKPKFSWTPTPPTIEAMIAENVARENLEELAERAVGEYRELVAVVIDAVLTLGPANEPDTVRCWAESRLNDATQMLIETVAQAGQGGGVA